MNKNLYKIAIAWVLAITLFTVVFPSMTQDSSQTKANKETLIAFSEAEAARDYELLVTYLTEDFVRHSVATEAVMPDVVIDSRDAYVAFLQGTAAEFPDYVTEPQILVANEDFVAFYSMFTGTSAETGNRISTPVTGIFRFEDGLIAEMWVEWDNLDWDMQMNAVEEPVTDVADIAGVWEIRISSIPLRLEYRDNGKSYIGTCDLKYGDVAYETYELEGNQLTIYDREYDCAPVYEVFVGRRPDGRQHYLRFELVGDDCAPDRKEALAGQTLYPW